MPIRAENRYFYPIDWPQLSRTIRFKRAKGRCETCGRRHLARVRVLPDGRWIDLAVGDAWRDRRGRHSAWPDIIEVSRGKISVVVLACCHRDRDPVNNHISNLAAWCQWCNLDADRPSQRRRAGMTIKMRRSIGDLFSGPYRRW
ncbi:hypothetical protein N825_21055 [Skermanella stibiiresistens SB22]|uniref:HNH endonuclease n=1 Tax=Skermanella stibiiresistens SB22 TaxID=1385369 RepID=W9GTL1_9PROT|nr:hypothetical protein [Skermanella stibiiresistens]EWY37220.1 hypothetical protein N825_21055 [Skermanella stibiiresistens SB22]